MPPPPSSPSRRKKPKQVLVPSYLGRRISWWRRVRARTRGGEIMPLRASRPLPSRWSALLLPLLGDEEEEAAAAVDDLPRPSFVGRREEVEGEAAAVDGQLRGRAASAAWRRSRGPRCGSGRRRAARGGSGTGRGTPGRRQRGATPCRHAARTRSADEPRQRRTRSTRSSGTSRTVVGPAGCDGVGLGFPLRRRRSSATMVWSLEFGRLLVWIGYREINFVPLCTFLNQTSKTENRSPAVRVQSWFLRNPYST